MTEQPTNDSRLARLMTEPSAIMEPPPPKAVEPLDPSKVMAEHAGDHRCSVRTVTGVGLEVVWWVPSHRGGDCETYRLAGQLLAALTAERQRLAAALAASIPGDREQLTVYEVGDRFGTITKAGRARVYEVAADGTCVDQRPPEETTSAEVAALVEFLLARIADDEAAAPRYGDRACPYYYDDPYGVGALHWSPERMLAECEAKRRIVNACRSGWPEDDRYSIGWHDFRVQALIWLALPYAGHHDYRQEWRP